MSTSSDITSRTLHLVDLENLAGGSRASTETTLHVFDDYLAAAQWRPGDHVIVASNPGLIGRVMYDIPVPSNVHAMRGQEGADMKLLACAPPELVVKRYGRLVLGSGDGIFATRAAIVRAGGVSVEVVTRPDACSWRLRTFDYRYLTARASDIALAA